MGSLRRFTLCLVVAVAAAATTGSALWHALRLAENGTDVSPVPLVQRVAPCFPMGNREARFSCFRTVLYPEMERRLPRDIIEEFDRSQGLDSRVTTFCHDMVHLMGRHWISSGRSIADGFRDGSHLCESGFHHGILERAIRGETADGAEEAAHVSPTELRTRVPALCIPQTLRTQSRNDRFQCLHGMGHALTFVLGYRLPLSLEFCDLLADDWEKSSCYGGVFMENLVGVERDRRMVRDGDPQYPCNAVQGKYRDQCYGMQTTRMLELGMSWDSIAAACREAGPSRLRCFQSMGRDLSSYLREKGLQKLAAGCAILRSDERRACLGGTIKSLTWRTLDGHYAYPYCASFDTEVARRECFTDAQTHLLNELEQPRAKLEAGCRALAEGQDVCLRALTGVRL